MSDKMTAISLPGYGHGTGACSSYADWGDHEPAEMIRRAREIAANELRVAQAVLDAPDEAFVVETYRGPWAQRGRKQIWPKPDGAA